MAFHKLRKIYVCFVGFMFVEGLIVAHTIHTHYHTLYMVCLNGMWIILPLSGHSKYSKQKQKSLFAPKMNKNTTKVVIFISWRLTAPGPGHYTVYCHDILRF